jgi:hypothetical protein
LTERTSEGDRVGCQLLAAAKAYFATNAIVGNNPAAADFSIPYCR